jgi:murein DD-endopeptidase MepM/ murein hydrolase activator NlpD
MFTRILTTLFISAALIPYATVGALPPAAHALHEEEGNELATDTMYQQAIEDVQRYTAPATLNGPKLDRGSYSATTVEEVAAIRAARAEEARKKTEEEARVAAVASSGGNARIQVSASNCSSAYCWPLESFNYVPANNGFRTASRPDHNGFDMLAPAGTPIYAVADGTVTLSSESHYGFGVAVVVNSVIDGQNVQFTYGHMTYGSRMVVAGQTVKAGQPIGLVGSTGRSTANHLHLEIQVNGAMIDPYSWMNSRAGGR